MPGDAPSLADRPESLVVGLAQAGDQDAFADLVRRRQSWLRNLMRRLSGDPTLADDLAQQVLLQAWRRLSQLRQPSRFGPWLKRLAVTVWLQHLRRTDTLRETAALDESWEAPSADTGVAIDLDRALSALPDPVRLCIVLSYHEGMSHADIVDATGLPAGTVKSHIRRGTQRLRQTLCAYGETAAKGKSL